MDSYTRARAYEQVYQWHIGLVPETISVNGTELKNPARTSAIFVVHGMGKQTWAETAALLRSGFEDVLEEILKENPDKSIKAESLPPPFIQEGFWAEYTNLRKTFPEEYSKLDSTKTKFFESMWKKRTHSARRAFIWFVKQQVKLIHPSVIWKIHPIAWLLYLPLQLVSLSALIVFFILMPKVMAEVLGDVRLYVAPEGIIERAIVQRIDQRIGASFLKMLGLTWDFLPLDKSEFLMSNGQPLVFDRVFWVAHSLGSVISYNVLSDLFQRAEELSAYGSEKQKEGVVKFRLALRRFITIGSPLDKIAFLCGTSSLKPWSEASRMEIMRTSRKNESGASSPRHFWINFFHVFDPVSGALQNPFLCGKNAPQNFHIGFWKIPGYAHVRYWKDRSTLKYILSRLYGQEFLPVRPINPSSPFYLTLLALIGYSVWGAIIAALLAFLLYLASSPFLSVVHWFHMILQKLFPCM